MVCSVKIVHLACIKISTISKCTETRFYMTHVTYQFHHVCPEQFLSLWYVQHKQCTYLALTLTLSPNWSKWDSTRPTSPRSFIGACKMISEPMVCSAQTVHLSCVKIITISKQIETSFHLSLVTRSTIECIQNDFWGYSTLAQTVHLSGPSGASRLALSPNGSKQVSTWAFSPRSTIRCI
jgi:hypothetical protein